MTLHRDAADPGATTSQPGEIVAAAPATALQQVQDLHELGSELEQMAEIIDPAAFETDEHGCFVRPIKQRLLAFSKANDITALRHVDPTDAMIDRGVAYALNVTVSGEGGWSQYVRNLFLRMMSARTI